MEQRSSFRLRHRIINKFPNLYIIHACPGSLGFRGIFLSIRCFEEENNGYYPVSR